MCFEVFMDATTISCGHTFCKNCICEWQKRNSNCPLCRMDIKQMVGVKTLDRFVEKIYGHAMGMLSDDVKTEVSAIPIQPTKEWHTSLTHELRTGLVHDFFRTIIFPDPFLSNFKKRFLYEARKFEGYAYEAANSRSEYYNLIAVKIYKIHKEMEEKRTRRN